MSYVNSILGPHENIVFTGKLHPIIYMQPLLVTMFGLGSLLVAGSSSESTEIQTMFLLVGLVIFLSGIVLFVSTAINQATTEIAVTNKRVVFKRGFIQRNTMEMNLDKIESVFVNQSMLGRILNYGDVDVRGTGSSIEDLDYIVAPIALRRSLEEASSFESVSTAL